MCKAPLCTNCAAGAVERLDFIAVDLAMTKLLEECHLSQGQLVIGQEST